MSMFRPDRRKEERTPLWLEPQAILNELMARLAASNRPINLLYGRAGRSDVRLDARMMMIDYLGYRLHVVFVFGDDSPSGEDEFLLAEDVNSDLWTDFSYELPSLVQSPEFRRSFERLLKPDATEWRVSLTLGGRMQLQPKDFLKFNPQLSDSRAFWLPAVAR